MTIDPKELEWWCAEYPELPEDDILWVLENIDDWDYDINTENGD